MIDCASIAAKHKAQLRLFIAENKINAALAVIQVGRDPASVSYMKGKERDCGEVGIRLVSHCLPETVGTEYVLNLIQNLNRDSHISGIIVQLPLPKHLDKDKIISAISGQKDVDGLKVSSKFMPCTLCGAMMVLDAIGVSVDSKVCCVVGRGKIGKPMADLLTKRNATVICCNSHTRPADLQRLQMESDIVVSAAGVPGLIPRSYNGQVILDFGVSRGADGKLYGDVSKCCYHDAANITPVPGGMGLLTRVALLENTVYGVNRCLTD